MKLLQHVQAQHPEDVSSVQRLMEFAIHEQPERATGWIEMLFAEWHAEHDDRYLLLLAAIALMEREVIGCWAHTIAWEALMEKDVRARRLAVDAAERWAYHRLFEYFGADHEPDEQLRKRAQAGKERFRAEHAERRRQRQEQR